jgi:hypothetical protein
MIVIVVVDVIVYDGGLAQPKFINYIEICISFDFLNLLFII